MKFNQISIGTRLELELYNKDGDKIRPTLISQFEIYDSSNTIEVYSPISEGKIYPIHNAQLMDICFEKNGEMYFFKAKAKERTYKGKVAILKVTPISDIEKIQRRSFYRLEHMLGVKFRIFNDLKTDPEDRGNFENGVSADISGGGMKLIMNDPPKLGDFIECKVKLDKEINFIAQIVRVITISSIVKKEYEIGLEFKKISNRDREIVISYIFERQRNMLKKGWRKI